MTPKGWGTECKYPGCNAPKVRNRWDQKVGSFCETHRRSYDQRRHELEKLAGKPIHYTTEQFIAEMQAVKQDHERSVSEGESVKTNHNPQVRKDVLDAIREGYSVQQTAELLNFSSSYISNILTELTEAGSIIRESPGHYRIPEQSSEAPAPSRIIEPKSTNGHVVESDSRTVMLPEYMRQRASVTIYVERSPEEIEQAMRLELCIGDNWIPLPVLGDIRLCVGDDVPRYSATQEVYRQVKAYRITLKNGVQMDYAHNPDVPLTVDRK